MLNFEEFGKILGALSPANADFDALGETLGILLSFVVICVGIVVAIVKKSKGEVDVDDDVEPFDEVDKNAQGFLTEEQRRYQNQLKQKRAQAQSSPPQQMQSTIDFHADDHSHTGAMETYDPIVGSLGDHSDEGCDELDGVRLIATDLMYEDDDNNVTYDYKEVRKILILGDLLNNPRFKTPYGKR